MKPDSDIRRIAFVMQPALRFFLIEVARGLRARTGARIHAFVSTEQEVAFYRRYVDEGLFAEVTNSEFGLKSPPASPAGAELAREARSWESRLGIAFGLLAVGNRHFGRGFALEGPGHPRSRISERIDLDGMIAAYVWQCRFWDKAFANEGFDLVVNGPPILARFARLNGVPYRMLLGARIQSRFFWAHDEYFHSPLVERAFRALPPDFDGDAALDAPYLFNRVYHQRFLRDHSLPRLGARLLRMVATRAYHHLRGYEKARGYYLSENLRYAVATWVDTRRMIGPGTVRLAELEGRPFAFFPLHTEPEASVGQISPEFFFQHAAIAALARDMPAGTLVAVKETVAGVGRRPREFYDQLRDLKNVVLLDMREHGLDVVRKARLVATISGTAGMEAAILGRPVISFGRHNIYGFLPHVHAPADVTDLSDPVRRFLGDGFDDARARRDGARFLRALVDTSFDMRGYSQFDPDRFEPVAVADATDSLFETLAGSRALTGSPA